MRDVYGEWACLQKSLPLYVSTGKSFFFFILETKAYMVEDGVFDATWLVGSFCITLDKCHLKTPYQPLGALQPLCHCV